MNKAVFLDRDGTLIENVLYLKDVEKVKYLPHTFEGLKRIQQAGFQLIVVTNQSGIARRRLTLEELHKVHRKIAFDMARQGITILDFYFAPFMGEHPLRKPNPGMILEAARDYRISLKESWILGDRRVDVEAGRRAGLKAHVQLLTTDYSVLDKDLPQGEVKASHMMEAADIVLADSKKVTI